jgi:type II secretory pathway pseudopilin PulG
MHCSQTLVKRARANARGFTLVELMVALTGGLIVSLAVFALARDSGRFYQRESRVANATVSAVLGFERLRTDIARAGFLSSPNIARDITVCSKPAANWPTELRSLASIQITQPVSSGALLANGRTPPVLLLAGSYTSADSYAAVPIPAGNNVIFQLEVNRGSFFRLGNGTNPTQAIMQATFPVGGTLRFMQYGKQYYGQIVAASGGTAPTVTVNSSPPLQFRAGSLVGCGIGGGLQGNGVGTINVVNFIEYSVRNLSTGAQTVQAQSDYASLYTNSADGPGEAQRTELVRVEKNINGVAIEGTEEIVAEYAVDLGIQISAVTSVVGCCDPTVSVIPPTSGTYGIFTGNVFNSANTPELIRTVRVRLGIRSRESDRPADVAADVGADTTRGLFRFNLGTSTDSFARVRTFQADVALRNQMDILW